MVAVELLSGLLLEDPFKYLEDSSSSISLAVLLRFRESFLSIVRTSANTLQRIFLLIDKRRFNFSLSVTEKMR